MRIRWARGEPGEEMVTASDRARDAIAGLRRHSRVISYLLAFGSALLYYATKGKGGMPTLTLDSRGLTLNLPDGIVIGGEDSGLVYGDNPTQQDNREED